MRVTSLTELLDGLLVARTSADDWDSKANSTDLAFKGIVGIGAMAEISRIMQRGDEADHYAVSSVESTVREVLTGSVVFLIAGHLFAVRTSMAFICTRRRRPRPCKFWRRSAELDHRLQCVR